MTLLNVRTNTIPSYEIHIGAGVMKKVGELLRSMTKAGRVCILSDDNVYPIYGKTVTEALEAQNFAVTSYVIPHGEHSKNLETYGKFQNFLAEEQLTRADWLLALGGGVVGDLCGFAAATYLRGVPYVQVPTSLLAMVDSSVGGKTAVDLPAGKNLCGAFYPPSLVLCDTDALSTLTDEFFADGMAEVIKYGMIFDKELLDILDREGKNFDREAIVARSIAHKIRTVEADEFDHGERQLLNFGHTPAHGIEQLSGYTIPHGHAVASGMAIMTRAAEAAGLCEAGCAEKLSAILEKFDLPDDTEFPVSGIASALLNDKKRKGGILTWVMPRKYGFSDLYPMAVGECEAFLAGGMRK